MNSTTADQPSITSFIQGAKKYSSTDPRQTRITNAITDFVAGTLQSLSVVESNHFKGLIQSLDSRAAIPSRKHLSTNLIKNRANEIKKMWCLKLQRTSDISIMIDTWSNRQMRSFIGITVQYLSGWKVEQAMLACKRFKGRHTAENVVSNYEEVLSDYEIGNKISHVITRASKSH